MTTSDFERLLDELSGSTSSTPIVEESITDSASLKAVAKRNIDPIAAAKLIDHDYRRFLKTLLRPKSAPIRDALHLAVDESPSLSKGPLIELTPPYASGRTIADLVSSGVLSPGMANLGKALPASRPLYQHQESAIEKIRDGRNLIVSTGTGSGKTESFLIPILDSLLRERDAGTLRPGVRAFLLYPMNALANDQVKRLRELLAETPEITFGRYTGETPQTEKDARNLFKDTNRDQPLLSNELISRDQMQKTPPHILLTNYAMLEYLLLRPTDSAFFDGVHADSWSFIVLDEAHVYAGAQGTEIGMLLRRLKDRVSTPTQSIQCIATSASLQGEKSEVMKFGSSLFDAPFEFVEDDPNRQDLVTATRKQLPVTESWALQVSLFHSENSNSDLAEALRVQASNLGITEFEALNTEAHIVSMRKFCADGSKDLTALAHRLWPDTNIEVAQERVHKLVTLGATTVDASGVPAVSARYHMFVRASEGAFLSLREDGSPIISLSRKKTMGSRPVYEMATCKTCGGVHLLGTVIGDTFLSGSFEKTNQGFHWALLNPQSETVSYNEDDSVEEGTDITETQVQAMNYLCFGCGKIYHNVLSSCANADCSSHAIRPVKFYSTTHSTKDLDCCLDCGSSRNNQVSRLLTDADLAPATLASSLFQLQPAAPGKESAVGQGRKLLTFSDSRQAAAFAAPYLERMFNKNVERRILLTALAEQTSEGPITLLQWVKATSSLSRNKKLHHNGQNTDASYWVFGEATSIERNLSLEGLALAAYSIDRKKLDAVIDRYGALRQIFRTDDDCHGFINLLLGELRLRGALELVGCSEFSDEHFLPRKGGWACRRDSGGDTKKQIYSWFPATGKDNYRLAFTKKALKNSNLATRLTDESQLTQAATVVLSNLWDSLIAENVLVQLPYSEENQARGISASSVVVQDGNYTDWYQCSKCGTVTCHNCAGLCPSRACDGNLAPLDTDSSEFQNHYFRWLARNMSIQLLRASEHTAQWQPKKAAEIQNDFIEGKINVLSCSTTFELGVDVGELQSVMMRNMPPRTSNYVQRAGRAGRRAGSAAFVLTYARRAAHDMSIYQHPEQMIDGIMRTPYLSIDNHRIVTRHCYSVLLATFLRMHANQWWHWRTVKGLFLPEDPTDEGLYKLMAEFLVDGVPTEVQATLERIVPPSLKDEIGISNGSWTTEYLELIKVVEDALRQEWDDLKAIRLDAFKQRKSPNRYDFTINTLENQETLGFMASRNLLPKYGFPVDSVELDTFNSGIDGHTIHLNRDLSLAIGDYAPGAQVVAGGRLWTSAGVRILPGRGLPRGYLHVCPVCNEVNYQAHRPFEAGTACPGCGSAYSRKQVEILQPIFGFVAARETNSVNTSAPKNYWSRESYVLDTNMDVVDSFEYETSCSAPLMVSARKRAQILVINKNNEQRFFICESCGAEVKSRRGKHKNPRTNRECFGTADAVALGHLYQTDIATIECSQLQDYEMAHLNSAMYALLESASVTLELNRDDIDATVAWSKGEPHFVLFDAVPGGAGITKEIVANFPAVLDNAIKRVTDCECDADTSCYACLRSYSNQRFHDQLRRDYALEVLRNLALTS